MSPSAHLRARTNRLVFPGSSIEGGEVVIPELADMPQSAVDEMTSRTASHFTTVLLGPAILVPWLLIVISIMTGTPYG